MRGAAAIAIGADRKREIDQPAAQAVVPVTPLGRSRGAALLAGTQYVVVVGVVAWFVYRGGASMQYQWQWSRIPPLFWGAGSTVWAPGPLIRGLIETLRLTAIVGAFSLIAAVTLAMARLSSSWSATVLSGLIVSIARNTPLIVQVSMFYFVLAPLLGIGRFWSGVASLVLFESAFMSEIVRSGILSIPAGQWEGGAALGLSQPVVLARIILPQALLNMLPSLTNAAVSLVKDTSIVSVIALFELTTAGRNAISETYMSFEIWLTVAAIYLALTVPLSLLSGRLERSLSRPFQGISRAKR